MLGDVMIQQEIRYMRLCLGYSTQQQGDLLGIDCEREGGQGHRCQVEQLNFVRLSRLLGTVHSLLEFQE
jgi:hypothetical protein